MCYVTTHQGRGYCIRSTKVSRSATAAQDSRVPTAYVTAPADAAERSDETDALPPFADWLEDAVARPTGSRPGSVRPSRRHSKRRE